MDHIISMRTSCCICECTDYSLLLFCFVSSTDFCVHASSMRLHMLILDQELRVTSDLKAYSQFTF